MPDLFTDQVPLKDDPSYHELLRELARVIADQLQLVSIDVDQADAIAETVTEHVREHFGGVPHYWPKGDSYRRVRRRAAMWNEFNGTNHAYLARKHGMCLQTVYKQLAIAKREHIARTQHSLLGPLEDSVAEPTPEGSSK